MKEYKKKWLFIYVFIILVGALFAFLTYKKAKEDYGIALEHYKNTSFEEAKTVAEKVEDVTTQVYKNVRTISFLPSVRKIDRHGSNLDSDDHKTIQEIYNNLASSVSVSEVYIVPVDLDPEKIDAVTGKPEEPIMMFDQLIVGRSRDQLTSSENAGKGDSGIEPLDEVEIYEYRLLREQMAWFRQHYPTLDKIDGINVPIISGKEVITCDNSRISRVTMRDEDRSGLVFSVPFYGPDGALKGSVSAIILSHVFRDILPKQDYALVNPAHAYVAMSYEAGQERKSSTWVTNSKQILA